MQKRQTETALQMAVVRWARANAEKWPALAYMYHCANEGKTDPREAGKRKSMGVLAGVADLTLPARCGDFGGLYLELKNGKAGRLSPEQRDFLQWAASQGYKTAVAYSFDEAVEILTDYLEAANG